MRKNCPDCGHPIEEHGVDGCLFVHEYSEGQPISGCECTRTPADLQPDLQTAKDKIIAIQEDILSKAHKKMTDKPQPISTTSDRNIKHKVTGSHMTIQKGKPQPEHCKLGHDWKCTECPEFISDVSDNLSHTQRCMHEIQAEPEPTCNHTWINGKPCIRCGKPYRQPTLPAEPDSRKKHCTVCGHKVHGEEDNKCLEVVYQDEFSNKQYCQCMGSIEGCPDSRKVEKHTCDGCIDIKCSMRYAPMSVLTKCGDKVTQQPTPTEQMPLTRQRISEIAHKGDTDHFTCDNCPFSPNDCKGCSVLDVEAILMAWLPAHDQQVWQEFAEKIDDLFLSKANLVLRGGGPDRWIITKQDWNSIVRALVEERD